MVYTCRNLDLKGLIALSAQGSMKLSDNDGKMRTHLCVCRHLSIIIIYTSTQRSVAKPHVYIINCKYT